MPPRQLNCAKALATLGERWRDSGNGSLSVRTHAGLEVTLTLRERHPSEPAQRLIIDVVDAKRRGLAKPAIGRKGNALFKPQQELVRRKLVEIYRGFGVLRLLRPTKAGRIAAKRFRVMLLNAQRRILRAARAARAKMGKP